MSVTGVLVVTSQNGRMWVGPQPAHRLVLRSMREVRCLSTVVVCNFTGRPLDVGGEADVIDMGAAQPGPQLDALVVAKNLGPILLLAHTDTPLIPAAVMERVAEHVADGGDLAQTCLRVTVATDGVAGGDKVWPRFTIGYVPVYGVRAFRASRIESIDRHLYPVEVTKKQGLSLFREDDLELVQALEHAGRI